MRVVSKSLKAVALAAGFGLVGMASAQALPFINGSLGLSDDGITLSNLPTSIVSALTTITQGPPAVSTPSGAFTGANATGTATTIVESPASGSYTVTVGLDVFTFNITGISGISSVALHVVSGTLLGDSQTFNVTGTVTDSLGNFAATGFAGTVSLSGSCIEATASPLTCATTGATLPSGTYASTLVATGTTPPSTPEPASLALLGTALLGFGAIRRLRRRT